MSTSPTSVSRDVYTNLYLEHPSLHDDCVHLSQFDFNRWFSNSNGLMAVKIYNDNDEFRVCSVGAPHSNANESVYIPQQITEDLKTVDYGNEHVWIEPITEDIPSATKLVLRPYNSSFFEFDTNDLLRDELDKYFVIQEGITIKVNVYGIDHLLYMEGTEPAPIVKLGGEVSIEFREPIVDDVKEERDLIASAIQEDTSGMDSIVDDLRASLPLAESIQPTLTDMWSSAVPQQAQPLQPSKEELRAARLRFYEKQQQQQQQQSKSTS